MVHVMEGDPLLARSLEHIGRSATSCVRISAETQNRNLPLLPSNSLSLTLTSRVYHFTCCWL